MGKVGVNLREHCMENWVKFFSVKKALISHA